MANSKYAQTALLMDEALLLLLEKKDFEFITVKEICEKAGVNRSTFYLHYENTSDLLAETVSMIHEKFRQAFRDKELRAKDERFFITPEYLYPFLSFVKENKKTLLLTQKKPHLFQNQKAFDKTYCELFSPILDTYGVPASEKPYVFEFFTKGTLAIVIRWLEDGCRDELGFIAELIIRVIGHAEKA